MATTKLALSPGILVFKQPFRSDIRVGALHSNSHTIEIILWVLLFAPHNRRKLVGAQSCGFPVQNR